MVNDSLFAECIFFLRLILKLTGCGGEIFLEGAWIIEQMVGSWNLGTLTGKCLTKIVYNLPEYSWYIKIRHYVHLVMKSDLFGFKISDCVMSKCNDSEGWNIVNHCEQYWKESQDV